MNIDIENLKNQFLKTTLEQINDSKQLEEDSNIISSF